MKTQHVQVKLPPGGSDKGIVKVTPAEYVDKLVDQSAMKIFVMGKVKVRAKSNTNDRTNIPCCSY